MWVEGGGVKDVTVKWCRGGRGQNKRSVDRRLAVQPLNLGHSWLDTLCPLFPPGTNLIVTKTVDGFYLQSAGRCSVYVYS